MLRTGEEYRQSLHDDRDVWIDGERVTDVTTLRIPDEVCHLIQGKAATHSIRKLPPDPVKSATP